MADGGKSCVSRDVCDALESDSFLNIEGKPSPLESTVYEPLKVFLRVRPFAISELESHESQGCVTIKDAQTVILSAPKESSAMKNSERGIGHAVHSFTFSQVFGPETTQSEFFEGSTKDIVRAYINGVNGLVFTYGVTNAGKTFTIQGTSKDLGILPRSLDVIFNHIRGRHYLKMNFKPYLSSDVKKLEDEQVKQEEALKTAILASLKEPFFCGKGKACMIVNINQHPFTYDETLHVMKFSAIARQVIQTILPKNFGYFPPKLVGGDGKPIMHFDANTSVDDFTGSTETSAEEEVDITILSHEELLKAAEDLKEKVAAERQSKLFLEVKIRKEMAEAMFQQLLETEEAWRQVILQSALRLKGFHINRLEDLKDSYEEKLESKFEMYKEAIKKHAYMCAMEQIEDHYVPIEEFLAEQEKVEDRERKILQLQRQLDEQSGRLLALGSLSSDVPATENNMERDLMDRTLKRATEVLQKQCEEKEELIKSLKCKIQKLNESLLEANEGYRKMAEENSQLKHTIMLKDQEMTGLQNWAKRVLELEETVSSLQKELGEQKKHFLAEESKQQKPRRGFLANLKSTVASTDSTPLGKGWGRYEESSLNSRKHVLLPHKAKE
ncbi:Kinesin-like protein KIF20A [Turdus rufiventris]|nr:Kinesin-like protein KIF20A [Turdus rufiventris]